MVKQTQQIAIQLITTNKNHLKEVKSSIIKIKSMGKHPITRRIKQTKLFIIF